MMKILLCICCKTKNKSLFGVFLVIFTHFPKVFGRRQLVSEQSSSQGLLWSKRIVFHEWCHPYIYQSINQCLFLKQQPNGFSKRERPLDRATVCMLYHKPKLQGAYRKMIHREKKSIQMLRTSSGASSHKELLSELIKSLSKGVIWEIYDHCCFGVAPPNLTHPLCPSVGTTLV